MIKPLLSLLLCVSALSVNAQTTVSVGRGGITAEMLQQMRKSHPTTNADRALRNALAGTSINQLATQANNPDATDRHFSNEVPSKGITDQ